MDGVSHKKFDASTLWKLVLIILFSEMIIWLSPLPLFIFFAATSGNLSYAMDSTMNFHHSMWGQTLSALLSCAGYILIVLIFLRASKLPVLYRLSLGHLRDAPKLLLAGGSLTLVMYLLPMGVGILFGVVAIREYGLTDSGVTGVALSTLLAAIETLSIGIGEEVLFRGYIQRTLEGRYGIALALPVGAAIFAIVHIPNIIIGGSQDPLSIVSIFVTGLMLGYLFYKTGSLWVCIGWHFMADFLSTQFISGMSGYEPFFTITQATPVTPSAPWLGLWLNIMITGFSIIALLLIIIYYHNRGPAKPGAVTAGSP